MLWICSHPLNHAPAHRASLWTAALQDYNKEGFIYMKDKEKDSIFSVHDNERTLIWIDRNLVLHKAEGVTPEDVIAVLNQYIGLTKGD